MNTAFNKFFLFFFPFFPFFCSSSSVYNDSQANPFRNFYIYLHSYHGDIAGFYSFISSGIFFTFLFLFCYSLARQQWIEQKHLSSIRSWKKGEKTKTLRAYMHQLATTTAAAAATTESTSTSTIQIEQEMKEEFRFFIPLSFGPFE